MNPVVVPASTITTAGAGAAVSILVWAAKQFANIDVPREIGDAAIVLASLLACHNTNDSPSPAIARAAVDVAAAKDDVQQKMDTAIAVAAASRLPTAASRMIVTDERQGA